MKTTKNIARLAITAGLTAALSFGGVMAPVSMAFAAEGTSGSITISQAEGNDDTTFKAYQIFKATVTDTENGKTAQNITWVNDALGEAVVNAIKSNWTGYSNLSNDKQLSENPTAQEVADFLMANAGSTTAGSPDGSSKGTRIKTDNVLYAVANAVKDQAPAASNIAAGTSWTPGAENGSGYYLFVTDGDSLGPDKKNTGTSPIFAVVGGSAVTVCEKTNIPTVEKKILDDSKVTGGAITGEAEANWKDAADSQIDQEVNYRLTGTIADNYDSYDSYSYKFMDQLTDGLDYINSSLSVYALNNGVYTEIDSSSYNVDAPSESNHRVLTVNFIGTKGLKSATAKNGGTLSIDANTKIVVFYKAKLNAKAVIAGANNKLEGNPNTVTLEYSNNPMVSGTGTSAPDTVVDYTYGLKINKVDLGTEAPLKDAEFTIKTKGDEKNAKEKYVAADGTLSDSEIVHKTGDDGSIRLIGLDAGTYTVAEKKAPNGYTAVSSFDFTITPTINEEGQAYKLTKLEGTLDSKGQNNKIIAGLNDKSAGKVGDNKLDLKEGTLTNTDGTFNITVGDTKQINLPLTGLNGVTFTWIVGGAVLCIGVAHLIRSRKRDDGSEE